MNPPRSRIALQLAAMLALVLVLLISVSTLFALRSLNEANLVTREKHLGSEAGLLADQLETARLEAAEQTLHRQIQAIKALVRKRLGR